ncbi:MAG: hypothetical protein QOH35_1617 [Acidobacteriaceae bacterium]|nr:hypothetical protein [Acidobacteriaceae bacterium]
MRRLRHFERSVAHTRQRAEPVGQVVAGAAVQLHPLAFLADDAAEPVVLDLVQPLFAA